MEISQQLGLWGRETSRGSMTELSPGELATQVATCDLFQEFFELSTAARYRRALQRARGWQLEPGDALPPPGWDEPAYVVLSGNLARAGSPANPEDGDAPSVQRVFHEWTSLADGLDAPDLVATEPSVVLEANRELVQLLLGGTPTRFKVEYYAPLASRSPVLSGITAEALDTAIRQSTFHAHNTREDLVTEGEFGTSVFFILAGRAAVILPEGAPRILEAGDFFGEVAYVSRQRRTATVRSSGPVLVMECRPHAVAKLIKASRPFKEAMDERYRAYGTFAVLSGMELFAGLADTEFRDLCRLGTLETFFQYEPVFFKGDPADALYVILNGTVTLTDEREGSTSPAGWLHAGDLFGEMALFPKLSGNPHRGLTVTALQRVTAIRFSREEVGDLVERYPAVGARILEIIERRAQGGLPSSQSRRPLEWVLDTQFLAGNHVLAVDLDNCIRCNNCVTACQSVHLDGQNRFFWSGMREESATLPRVSFSTSCQHCEVPLCLEACPQNCIERSPETGAVYIDYSLCTRCGVCADPAQGCPYGSIQKVPNAGVDPEASLPLLTRLIRRFSQQPAPKYGPERQANHYPVKCDLCEDLPFQACEEHCPTGAVFRVSGRKEFARFLQPGAGPAKSPVQRAPRTLYLAAEFATPPPTGRFSPLLVRVSESGPGMPVILREPENGASEIDLNIFLLTPDTVEVQGGREKAPLRRLTIGSGDDEGARFPVKCAKPGAQELVLCAYQGGLYLGRMPVHTEFVAPAPKSASAAPNVTVKEAN